LTFLVDLVTRNMRNKGNIALLQVALGRIARLFPGSTIEVLTDAPHILKYYAPFAQPLLMHPPSGWLRGTWQLQVFRKLVPRPLLRCLLELRDELSNSHASPGPPEWSAACQESRDDRAEQNPTLSREEIELHLLNAIRRADVVVVPGGGYLCDFDKPNLMKTLMILETASRLGKLTALLGLGVGPLTDSQLRGRLTQVLPSVSLILVRERCFAPSLLQGLGVPPSRILVTGDDAVEVAFAARRHRSGDGIGVSLRVAPYTQVDWSHFEAIRPVVLQAAQHHKARLVPIPISIDGRERDDAVINYLLKGRWTRPSRWRHYSTPSTISRRVGRCRIVVAGTFHAAVFALGQGIPVVALASSQEYRDKFIGLREEFGPACQIVQLGDDSLGMKLHDAIETAWESAPGARSSLLDAAVRQIQSGVAAYGRLRDLTGAWNHV
jgi:polysaccharide pyruvyl transferase WcaK-like protein